MTTNARDRRTAGTLRRRFWIESMLAAIAAGLLLLTLAWREWIEAFGIEPDGGDGSLEWALVGALALVALVLALIARTEWRGSRAPTPGTADARPRV